MGFPHVMSIKSVRLTKKVDLYIENTVLEREYEIINVLLLSNLSHHESEL